MNCYGHLFMLVALSATTGTVAAPVSSPPVVLVSKRAMFAERLAAHEVRRYLYVRTGQLPEVVTSDRGIPKGRTFFLVGQLTDATVSRVVGPSQVQRLTRQLNPEGYVLESREVQGQRGLVISGQTGAGVLRGAYQFVQTLGVRFSPAGDIIPDGKIRFVVPTLSVVSNPVMDVRGYFPYHSGNPQGPEYWNQDDYLQFIGQQAKLGMNLIAMLQHHRGDGSLDVTWTPSWDVPQQVGAAPFGMAKAFTAKDFRSENALPFVGVKEQRPLSDQNSAMLSSVYRFSRSVGVDSCMGGFLASGVDHWKTAFRYLDTNGFAPKYIWQHSYENWSYADPEPKLLDQAVLGFRDFFQAKKETGYGAQAVVSGWAIGPRKDPLLFDRELSKEVIIAPQMLGIGKAPVDPAYAKMLNRPKWVVPWLEDDFNMIAPQLWVRRMIANVQVGRDYGCTGLIATHWRTRVIEPQMIALAQLGWNGTLDAAAFYDDYARAAFGPEAGPAVGKLMLRMDGNLPIPTDWKDGWPGGIHADKEYWSKNKAAYGFVDELAALRPRVRGASSLARFGDLLGQWQYMRALGHLKSTVGTPDEAATAREAYTALLQTVTNSGELGDLIFLNLQVGKNKPMDYTGRPRLVVRTPRSSLLANEPLRLSIAVIESGSPKSAELEWRPLGTGRWQRVAAQRGYLNSYTVEIPVAQITGRDFEYRIRVVTSDGAVQHFPAGAPQRTQTVVVVPTAL